LRNFHTIVNNIQGPADQIEGTIGEAVAIGVQGDDRLAASGLLARGAEQRYSERLGFIGHAASPARRIEQNIISFKILGRYRSENPIMHGGLAAPIPRFFRPKAHNGLN
jgi:hypothetical protein